MQVERYNSSTSPRYNTINTDDDDKLLHKSWLRTQCANWAEAIKARCDFFKRYELVIAVHNWRLLAVGIFWQYVHSVGHNVAYWLHEPREPLRDLGFSVLPALTHNQQIISEIMFFMFLGATILFWLSPLLNCRHPTNDKDKVTKPLYGMMMVTRFFVVLALSQTLRIISFLSTSLPGPNYHCRPGSLEYNPPKTWGDLFWRVDAFFGCGDLVFSSHTTFVILFALSFHKYADLGLLKKVLLWCLVLVFGGFVIAARKHYTLDIVVALYTVPLVWIAYDHYYPDVLPPELQESPRPKSPPPHDIV